MTEPALVMGEDALRLYASGLAATQQSTQSAFNRNYFNVLFASPPEQCVDYPGKQNDNTISRSDGKYFLP